MSNPSRTNPQTDKPVNGYTSLVKTIGRVARFFPEGSDSGDWTSSKDYIYPNLSWIFLEMERIRGEVYTETMLSDSLRTTTNVLGKYHPDNWDSLSPVKQVECLLAWAILELDRPVTKEEFDAIWMGLRINLPPKLQNAYQKRQSSWAVV